MAQEPPAPFVYTGTAEQMFRLCMAKENGNPVLYDRAIKRDLYGGLPPWVLIDDQEPYAFPSTEEYLVETPMGFRGEKNQALRHLTGEAAFLAWKQNGSVKVVFDLVSARLLGTIKHFTLFFSDTKRSANWVLTEYLWEGNQTSSLCKLRIENRHLSELRKKVVEAEKVLDDKLLELYIISDGKALDENDEFVVAVSVAREGVKLAQSAVRDAISDIRSDNVEDYKNTVSRHIDILKQAVEMRKEKLLLKKEKRNQLKKDKDLAKQTALAASSDFVKQNDVDVIQNKIAEADVVQQNNVSGDKDKFPENNALVLASRLENIEVNVEIANKVSADKVPSSAADVLLCEDSAGKSKGLSPAPLLKDSVTEVVVPQVLLSNELVDAGKFKAVNDALSLEDAGKLKEVSKVHVHGTLLDNSPFDF